jgi:peptidoglycan hydrolase-like protein with peptidoglycan-binding domain
MKRLSLCFLAFTLSALGSLYADETVSAAQTRLKTGGFYFGEITGEYDNDTAAAITRYQIRNGLSINGKLDAQTSYALGLSETKPKVPQPKFGEDVWRYLRKSDQEQIQRMIAEDERADKSKSPSRAKAKTTVATTTTSKATPPPPAVAPPIATSDTSSPAYTRERLRDYIAAFILAGLDPQVGAETEFFAERVNYFGKAGVPRETIRRDLQHYNARWPQRSFSLAGELAISAANGNLTVTFPLRYDLRNAAKHSTGKVLKTLVLEKKGADDFQITAVDERKAK